MVAIYKAKSVTMATYGAGLWGYANGHALQIEENTFLKRLLYLPPYAANTIVHNEFDLQFLEDLLLVRPLLLWLSLWAKEETSFT